MTYDPEAVYQDADIEQAAAYAEGARVAAIEARGICTHGWVQGANPTHAPELQPGQIRCLENGCGEIFDSESDWLDARSEALGY